MHILLLILCKNDWISVNGNLPYTSLPCLSALWEGVQQDAQPNGPHASPLRQQTLQMPLLPKQVHAEGKPYQTPEGQTRRHGQRPG